MSAIITLVYIALVIAIFYVVLKRITPNLW